MAGPARSLFSRVLFAEKGEAAPAASPIGAAHPRAAAEAGAAVPRPLHRQANSPLSFLITRRAPIVGPEQPAIAVPSSRSAPPQRAVGTVDIVMRPPHLSRIRRSLTVRLEQSDYRRLRTYAEHRGATFQGLLEMLVLRFLATGGAPKAATLPAPVGEGE